MTEIEKKFQPTEEQLQTLLGEATFLGEKDYYDEYYDYPDFRLFTKDVRLRRRNGQFELKIGKNDFASGTANSEEIESEPEILSALGLDPEKKLADAVSSEMQVFAIWRTKRKKYQKDQFSIDVDQTDFGYNVCEIEVMVADPAEAPGADREIIELATQYGFALTKLPSKISEYIRRVKPEIYSKLYK